MMSNHLLFKPFDFDRLPTFLSERYRNLLIETDSSDVIPVREVLRELMELEPRAPEVALVQARSLFERLLEKLEVAEEHTLTAIGPPGLRSLQQADQVSLSSFWTRAMLAVQILNRQYAAYLESSSDHEVTQASFEAMLDAFVTFYDAMHEVALGIATANEHQAALSARKALIEANFGYELTEERAVELESQLFSLREQFFGRSESGSPSTREASNLNSAAFRRGVVNDEQVVIYSVEEHEAFRRKEAELELALRHLKREMRALDRLNRAVAEARPDSDIQQIMLGDATLAPVAIRWKEMSRARARLEKAIEAGKSVEMQKAKLHQQGKIYSTRDIVEKVFEVTKIPFTTDDVLYRLDMLAKQGFLTKKKPGQHWDLNLRDFEIACEIMYQVARKRERRLRK